MKPVNSELVWLASAIDFEGSILMYPNWTPYKTPTSIRANTTVLTNTDLVLIKYSRKLLKKYKIKSRIVPLSNGKRWKKQWNPAWRVEISKVDDNKMFLPLVYPYLIAKKKQCKLVMEFLSIRNSKHNRHRKTTVHEWELMAQCQLLNKRGL